MHMGDNEISECFAERREANRKHRWKQYDMAIAKLERMGIPYEVVNKNTAHVLVLNRIDFWPTTDKWRIRGEHYAVHGSSKMFKLALKELCYV